MACPVCGQRKARRACPALGADASVRCAAAPSGWSRSSVPPTAAISPSAREHPAAVVRRQQERDVALLLPTIRHLTERQYQLFFLFHTSSRGTRRRVRAAGRRRRGGRRGGARGDARDRGARRDLRAHAAGTARRRRLAAELKAMLEQMREQGAKVYDREAAMVLRAIEQGARGDRHAGRRRPAYLDLRRPAPAASPAEPPQPRPRRPAESADSAVNLLC